jgi:hypothetical protein
MNSAAPPWRTDHGQEWLGRLIIEPRRLWRRYLIGNPLFLWRVLKQRFALSDASLWIASLSKGSDVVTRLARLVQVCYNSTAGAALD